MGLRGSRGGSACLSDSDRQLLAEKAWRRYHDEPAEVVASRVRDFMLGSD